MNYQQAEADIVTRLQPFSGDDLEIVPLPENLKDFERPFTKGKITVCYKGSKWDKPHSTQQISQKEELTFEISMQSRFLRGSKGIYAIKYMVTKALLGFMPTDCDRMYAHESGMTGVATQNDGVWTYSYLLCCTSLVVEDFEEDLSVMLNRISNLFPQFPGDDFDVIPPA